MAWWLVKSEPDVYGWDRQVKDGISHWDGVRNHQAAANLKAMKPGDKAFFYHSNVGKEIVGVVELVRTAYPDPGDETGRFVMVDFKTVGPLKTPVTLAAIKATPELAGFALVKQSRLSVMPVSDEDAARLARMGGLT